MYCPAIFRESRLGVLHDFIRNHPLGLLVSSGSNGLTANLIPFLLEEGPGDRRVLRCHLARANPQWKEIDGQPVLVVFRGSDAYVSPSLYATKAETGKVVPTWNFAMVQARGTAQLREQAGWLTDQLHALTDSRESLREKPWSVTDAPADYIAAQMKLIVGIEIQVSTLEGKWKVSQNQPETNRRSVLAEFETSDATQEMAAWIKAYGNLG